MHANDVAALAREIMMLRSELDDLRTALTTEWETGRLVVTGELGLVEIDPGRVFLSGPNGDTGPGSSMVSISTIDGESAILLSAGEGVSTSRDEAVISLHVEAGHDGELVHTGGTSYDGRLEPRSRIELNSGEVVPGQGQERQIVLSLDDDGTAVVSITQDGVTERFEQ